MPTLLPIIFLFLDYMANSLLNVHLFHAQLCWFFLYLYAQKEPQRSNLAYMVLLLGLSSFLQTGYVGLMYIGLIPAAILCLILKPRITQTITLPILCALLTLTMQNLFYLGILRSEAWLPSYTIWQYAVTLILVVFLSLKIHGPAN